MINRLLLGPILVVAIALPASAHEYLTSVSSEVYQAKGTPKEIATRAATCISQHLAPGAVSADVFINKDIDGGIIVARSSIEYGGLVRSTIRSVFTLEAREDRFRIEQTNLERFSDQFDVGWHPIGKWAGSQWKGAEAAFVASAASVAQCIAANPVRADW